VSKIDLIASFQSKAATNAKAPVMKVAKCFLNSFWNEVNSTSIFYTIFLNEFLIFLFPYRMGLAGFEPATIPPFCTGIFQVSKLLSLDKSPLLLAIIYHAEPPGFLNLTGPCNKVR